MAPTRPGLCTFLGVMAATALALPLATAATTRSRYFAHPARHDRHGVIAPWYLRQNGQCDLRVRIAAETLKRYPWTSADRAVAVAPEYAFNSTWRISPDGAITIPPMKDWTCGDRSQMCARVLFAWVEYYRYSGDPAAIAHASVVARTLIEHNLTGLDHPWPRFLISVPVKGKPYADADPNGWIQLDIAAEAGLALLRTYQMTGDADLLEIVKHWADVLVEKRDRRPAAAPWPRYANPEQVRWGARPTGNVQTGGIVYQLAMLDELIRLGYTGPANGLIDARDAGRMYLQDTLLPAWSVNDTWGRNYWDWEDPVQAQTTTDWAARYLLANKDRFPNWKIDVRNILALFLNHTSVNPKSAGEVYSGAWAFPESLGCCGQSLAWGPMELAIDFARYGVEADSEWARELARRQQVLATYDAHETGVVEDNIDGGAIAAGGWLKATHPSALNWVLLTMGWLPETLGAARENHIMRTSAVVNSVVYGKGRIAYTTFDAPDNTIDVLRLAFEPRAVTAGGKPLARRSDLAANGYTVKPLPGGDRILTIRHDGQTAVVVEGDDPQRVADDGDMQYEGPWSTAKDPGAYGGGLHATSADGATMTFSFEGNQVRVLATVGPDGGMADVLLDGVKQLVGIDFWNPKTLHQQVVYYSNGLSNERHTLRIVATSRKNPLSRGTRITVDAVQFSTAAAKREYGGGGPTGAQRLVFGYIGREDLVDSQSHTWRPAAEFVVRCGAGRDSVVETWWTNKRAPSIQNTADPQLYQYGAHAPELIVNLTAGPGRYHVRLKFAETQYAEPNRRAMTIRVNGRKVADRLDVLSTAGGPARALDLDYRDVAPSSGIIEVRLTGEPIGPRKTEAMIQAIELLPAGR